jgi:hypothetical protein
MADVIVRDITPAQIYHSTQAAGEGQRFPNGKLKFAMLFL